MSKKNIDLFTKKVIAERQVYFFDVKLSQEGVKHLVITELHAAGGEFYQHQMMIFEENIEAFLTGLNETIAFLGIEHKPKSDRLEQIRKKYPKAYTKWSSDEDETLRMKFYEGMSVTELAIYFQRKPSAIRSRLERLGINRPE